MKRLLAVIMLWALPAVAREPLKLSRFVADVGIRADAMYLLPPTDRFIPGFGGFVHWGVRLSDFFAIVAAANCDFFFSPLGNVTFASLGPGIRFGEKHHLTISAAPSLLFFFHPDSPYLLATAKVDYAFIVTQNLAAQVQVGINFSTGGIPGGQIGLGFSWVKL